MKPTKPKLARCVTARVLLAVVLACSLYACAGVSHRQSVAAPATPNQNPLATAMPQAIGGGHQCQLGEAAFAKWIDSESELSQWQQRISRLFFLSPPSQHTTANFPHHAVILLSMGQQTSGGYALKLASTPLRISNQKASLAIEWLTPQAGMMLTQALTSPCILIEIPLGDFNTLDIVDQSGNARFTLKRPN